MGNPRTFIDLGLHPLEDVSVVAKRCDGMRGWPPPFVDHERVAHAKTFHVCEANGIRTCHGAELALQHVRDCLVSEDFFRSIKSKQRAYSVSKLSEIADAVGDNPSIVGVNEVPPDTRIHPSHLLNSGM